MLVLFKWKGGDNLSNQTTIGELSINLKMRLEGLEKGLETAKRKLQDIEKQNEQLKSSNSSIDASFIAMSVSIIASLKQIKSVIDDGVESYNKYVNSMQALQKTAKATNNSMTEIKNGMEDVNKFKFIDDADLSKSMQKLEDIMGVALFNRSKSHIELNETGKIAVKYAKQALKSNQAVITKTR